MRLFVCHFNSFIRVMLLYITIVIYWTAYKNYCFIHYFHKYFMIVIFENLYIYCKFCNV